MRSQGAAPGSGVRQGKGLLLPASFWSQPCGCPLAMCGQPCCVILQQTLPQAFSGCVQGHLSFRCCELESCRFAQFGQILAGPMRRCSTEHLTGLPPVPQVLTLAAQELSRPGRPRKAPLSVPLAPAAPVPTWRAVVEERVKKKTRWLSQVGRVGQGNLFCLAGGPQRGLQLPCGCGGSGRRKGP